MLKILVTSGLNGIHLVKAKRRGYHFETKLKDPQPSIGHDFDENTMSSFAMMCLLVWFILTWKDKTRAEKAAALLDHILWRGSQEGPCLTVHFFELQPMDYGQACPVVPAGTTSLQLEVKDSKIEMAKIQQLARSKGLPGNGFLFDLPSGMVLLSLLMKVCMQHSKDLRWLLIQLLCWSSLVVDLFSMKSSGVSPLAFGQQRPAFQIWDSGVKAALVKTTEKNIQGLGGAQTSMSGMSPWRQYWVQKNLVKYWLEMRRVFTKCRHLSIACDASRISSRETYMFALLNLESGKSCWAPFQAYGSDCQIDRSICIL